MKLRNLQRHLCAFAIIALFGTAPSTAEANLLVNGGFESPRILAGDPGRISANHPSVILLQDTWGIFNSIPGWTVAAGFPYIELQHGALYGAPHLGQFAELDIDSPAGSPSLTQSIQTEVGATYALSGVYAVRPDIEWQDGFVTVNGTTAAAFGGRGNRFNDPFTVVQGVRTNLAYHPNAAPVFLPFYLEFVGTGLDVIGLGSLHTVTPVNGLAQSPAGGGNLFDNLHVIKVGDAPNTEVPEPATMLLFGGSLMAAAARRRSAK
jgi:hypothetical protein